MPALAGDSKPRVVPVDEEAYGRSYEEWSAAWWQWALSIPRPDNPSSTPPARTVGRRRPRRCGSSPAPSAEGHGRTCAIPAGTPLFFPIISYLCAADPWTTSTYAAQLSCARSSNAGSTGTLEIDGTTVDNLEQHRVDSTEFSLTFVSDNVNEALPGDLQARCGRGDLRPAGPPAARRPHDQLHRVEQLRSVPGRHLAPDRRRLRRSGRRLLSSRCRVGRDPPNVEIS